MADDDTFRARVQKVFGSLSSSQSSSPRPPWSLTDDEVEKREWRRDTAGSGRDDDQIPCSSSFDGLFARGRKSSRSTRRERRDHDLEDHSDDDDDEQVGGGSSRQKHSSQRAVNDDDDGDRDDWEIRSSIGLDRTLDDEEEEDEYDKVAEGTENVGDFLYMSDVNNHGPYLNSHYVLPSSVYHASRDLRANRIAARTRLKEDEIEAQEFGSEPYWDKSLSNVERGGIKPSEGGGGGELKSILKRKINAADSKVVKRVKFDPNCKDNCEEASANKDLMTGTPSPETSISDDNSSLAGRVPDYVLNPSKYKCYSFDSSIEVNDEYNREVCMVLEASKPPGFESQSSNASSSDLPKSVTFIPRKKESETRPVKDNGSEVKQNQDDGCKQSTSIQTGFPLGIAAGETQRSELNVIEEELETNATNMSTGFQKPGRHYRAKSKSDDPVA